MKKNTLPLLLFFIFSCTSTTSNNKNTEIANEESSLILKPTFSNLQLNEKVKAAIDSLVVETNCDDCIHEIFIDKILPDSMIITLKARVYSSSYLKQINALFTMKIENCTFYVYTGLEDILEGNRRFILSKTDSLNTKFALWSLLIKNDTISILKDGYYPFFPGKPPNIEIRK